jgi:hypothetical protein
MMLSSAATGGNRRCWLRYLLQCGDNMGYDDVWLKERWCCDALECRDDVGSVGAAWWAVMCTGMTGCIWRDRPFCSKGLGRVEVLVAARSMAIA